MRRITASGQSLVELAIVLPVLLLLLGGAVQYGVIFAARHELTQVARDTARWASTRQTTDLAGVVEPCEAAATATPPQPLTLADQNAQSSGLIGYSAGTWDAANFTSYGLATMPPTAPNGDGVEVAWSGASCPPSDNSDVELSYVTVRLTHRVPTFLPGLWLLAGGSCDSSGCWISVSTTSTFRMEPPPP
jgi:Flp pilus assembly protein TadG